MSYYYINTDTAALGYSPHAKWIKYDRAFTSGDAPDSYHKYGECVLGLLTPGDMLFMYVSRRGVVAAGWVCEFWDRCAYRGSDRFIYYETAYTEYRIGVDWCFRVLANPIGAKELRRILDWLPRGWRWRSTFGWICPDKAERLLEEIRGRV